jgi:hypothetical protein
MGENMETSVTKGSSPKSKLSPREVSSLLKNAENLIQSGQLPSSIHPVILAVSPLVGQEVEVTSGTVASSDAVCVTAPASHLSDPENSPEVPFYDAAAICYDNGSLSNDSDALVIDLSRDNSSVDSGDNDNASLAATVGVKTRSSFRSISGPSETSSIVRTSPINESGSALEPEPLDDQTVNDSDDGDVLEIDWTKDLQVSNQSSLVPIYPPLVFSLSHLCSSVQKVELLCHVCQIIRW